MRNWLRKISPWHRTKQRFTETLNSHFSRLHHELDILKILQAKNIIANQNRESDDLSNVEFRAFSQYGEDGIIQYLISKVAIPSNFRTCVEIGCENFREANTRLLLELNNWRTIIFDGSEENIASIKQLECAWRLNFESHPAFVNRENVNHILKNYISNIDIGLLSLDIDGNDYWVWEALDIVSPIIVVIEYNGLLGCNNPIVVPYNPNFNRFKAHYSGLYWGASLKALELLGIRKGYSLIGSNSAGCNAFFVKNDWIGSLKTQTAEQAYRPSISRDARNQDGEFTYISHDEQKKLISDLEVLDISRNIITKLGNCG